MALLALTGQPPLRTLWPMTGPFLLALAITDTADAQECAGAVAPQALADAAIQGEQSFSDLNLEGLNAAATQAEADLPCVQEPLSLETAAAYHRLMGLSAFANGDRERVIYEFSAARVSEPGYSMPETLAPEGHPLQAAYTESLQLDGGQAETPVPPIGGYVMVAGVRDGQRKVARPTIVQVYQADGAWFETQYLAPGQAMPVWGPPPQEPQLAESRWRKRAIVAGVSAVAAGSLYGVAAVSGRRFDGESSQSELQQAYATNRASVAGASVSAVAAIGLGVWAVQTYRAEQRDD
ncbi:MAG: hypothetical protein ACI9VR_005405 [Cognaticolwellia sp.]|jgi:hypothetical protein